MSELIVVTLKIAFLALLWLFILVTANVIRSDLFGKRVPAATLATVPADRGRPESHRLQHVPTRFAITSGSQQGIAVPVEPTINLGRAAGSTLILEDEFASARHAQLVQRDEETWLVSDLRSTNGTFVNGKRVGDEPVPATVGDVIRIGRTLMRLEV
ncbi:FHA domain-containing protein [Tessaracoccus sp. OH4464_COT-324]|uniref:FHA domain-containing protein FhaB/FipA n=1 Tax=Tessaracoccus sp. OH4464_COT-324 TaxID=2491059 RepID=UPI000F640C4D|nr:FHA domain-containing protein [Tessaracoccus sp. OH4464_COT-324]RRD45924.1 FHA domain-containing protein [Tessaracoccus sp. OH4464_COT-324]